MNKNISRSAVSTLFLSALLFCSACGGPSKQTVDRVRLEVAAILKKDAKEINVEKPLSALGADDLDIVQIVMAVEKAFGVEIPDKEIGQNFAEIGKVLTVHRLAEIVSKQQKRKTK